MIDAEAPPPAGGPTPEQLQRLLALAWGSALRYWSPATEADRRRSGGGPVCSLTGDRVDALPLAVDRPEPLDSAAAHADIPVVEVKAGPAPELRVRRASGRYTGLQCGSYTFMDAGTIQDLPYSEPSNRRGVHVPLSKINLSGGSDGSPNRPDQLLTSAHRVWGHRGRQ